MANITVKLSFPNIGREFSYEYATAQDCTEQAMRSWYNENASTLFALYGYGPMDVTVVVDGEVVDNMRMCYQETVWHSYFDNGGGSWHGQFQRFAAILQSFRYQEDELNKKDYGKI